MIGTIVAYAVKPNRKTGWGYIDIGTGLESIFFHTSNSPRFTPVLGMVVEFEMGPPFRIGQKEQAVSLRAVPTEVLGDALGGAL